VWPLLRRFSKSDVKQRSKTWKRIVGDSCELTTYIAHYDLESLDFVINKFFMKLFRTNNIDTVNICQSQFCFELPSSVIKKRAIKVETN